MFFLFALLFSTAGAVYLWLLTRILGYRQISELTLFDYINSITIGSIAGSLAIAPGWKEAAAAAVGMAIYGAGTFFINLLSNRRLGLRRIASGRPIVLLRNRTMSPEAFRKARMDTDEFLMLCRCAGYFNPGELELAILETNGKLSFLPRREARPLTAADLADPARAEDVPVYCVISDGQIRRDNLARAGYDEAWLEKELAKNKEKADRVFLGVCGPQGELVTFRSVAEKEEPVQASPAKIRRKRISQA